MYKVKFAIFPEDIYKRLDQSEKERFSNVVFTKAEIGEDGVIENFGNTSTSRKRNQTCDHLVEGHEEGGADHGIPIVFQRDKNKMRVLSPRMHRKATEIRHGETEENED